MNDSTSLNSSPKEETLQFLKWFARMYQSSKLTQSPEEQDGIQTNTFDVALC